MQGLLGSFHHMPSLKMADAGVNRYLWNPFYCYSNQYIDLRRQTLQYLITDEFLFCCSLEMSKFVR